MTEGAELSRLAEVVTRLSRASGHELRNALNGVAVNLEMVRNLAKEEAVLPWIEQSIAQAEESVKLAEATVALLELIAGAIGEGKTSADVVAPDGVRFTASKERIERAAKALRSLAARGAIGVDATDTAVILTAPLPQSPTGSSGATE